jgi:hypothetical protein
LPYVVPQRLPIGVECCHRSIFVRHSNPHDGLRPPSGFKLLYFMPGHCVTIGYGPPGVISYSIDDDVLISLRSRFFGPRLPGSRRPYQSSVN